MHDNTAATITNKTTMIPMIEPMLELASSAGVLKVIKRLLVIHNTKSIIIVMQMTNLLFSCMFAMNIMHAHKQLLKHRMAIVIPPVQLF